MAGAPPFTVPYAPQSLFVPNGHLVDLIQQSGRDSAAMQLRQGDISAQLWGNIGQTIAGIPGQLQAQQAAQQKTALTNQALQSGALDLAAKQKAADDTATMNRIFQGAYGQAPSQQPGFVGPTQPGSPQAAPVDPTAPADPSAPPALPPGMEKNADGVLTFNRDYLTKAMAAAGQGAKIPGVIEQLTKADEAAATLAKTRGDVAIQTRDALGSLGATIEASGNTPGAFHLAALHAVSNGVVQPSMIKPYLDRVDADPTQVAAITKELQAGSPKQTELNAATLTAGARATTANTGASKTLQPTEASLAVDAATLGTPNETPTAAQSAGAMKILKPQVDKGRQAEWGLVNGKQVAIAFDPATGKRYDAGGNDVTAEVKPIPPASIQVNNQLASQFGPNAPESPIARSIAEYGTAPPSARTLASPGGSALMNAVLAINPEYDASKYSVRAPTRKAFTTGTQGQQIVAMNTAVEHLDMLQQAADAIKNGSFVPGNALYNRVSEMFGGAAPTNYDTIKNMVDKEVEAVANKGVPTVSGTAEQKALAGKSAGPEQIKGYINTLIPLMGSKLNALTYSYKQAMGDSDPFNPVTPTAQGILTKRGVSFGGSAAAPAASGGTVKMRAPNGQTTDVAADQVDHYKTLGATVVQ